MNLGLLGGIGAILSGRLQGAHDPGPGIHSV
jgi:hypothetical protein